MLPDNERSDIDNDWRMVIVNTWPSLVSLSAGRFIVSMPRRARDETRSRNMAGTMSLLSQGECILFRLLVALLSIRRVVGRFTRPDALLPHRLYADASWNAMSSPV